MKSSNKFQTLVFFASLSIGMAISSCATSKKEFSAFGTVNTIEFGKDGYTASLTGDDDKSFDALISRVRMQSDYKLLKVGDKVQLFGDTIHLDNKVRVLVKTIR